MRSTESGVQHELLDETSTSSANNNKRYILSLLVLARLRPNNTLPQPLTDCHDSHLGLVVYTFNSDIVIRLSQRPLMSAPDKLNLNKFYSSEATL